MSESGNNDVKQTKVGIFDRITGERVRKLPSFLWKEMVQVGRGDPRRILHAAKVGTALTAVTLMFLLGPLYRLFAQNAMWAIMTVVLVLEFTVGATLCKGFNRGVGTMCAGLLALLIDFFAGKSGHVAQVIIVGVAVFLIGFGATYVRFIPYIKKNYDYGVLIFLLTFNLIMISTFHVNNLFDMARDRFYTIAIGCGICLCMSLLILPNWSGEDLERATVTKLETLAKSIEACANDYFQDDAIIDEKSARHPIYKGYRVVLESKMSDEAQALFASWEPRHSRRRYPWQQYVKLGATIRHFAYTAGALHGCLESEIQAPLSLRTQFKEPCVLLAAEVTKVLNKLASSIKDHHCCPPKVFSDTLDSALQDLDSAIKSQPRLHLGPQPEKADLSSTLLHLKSKKVEEDAPKDSVNQKNLRHQLSRIVISTLEFSDALPLATFVSSLVEMVARLGLVIEEVEVLANVAGFKKYSKKESRKRVVPEVKEEGRVNLNFPPV